MSIYSKYILILFLIILNGCEKQKPILVQIPEEELKLDVYPKSVFIGYKIIIVASQDVDFGHPNIVFPDSTIMYADSIINDTLYTTVPYTNIAGPLFVESSGIDVLTDPLTILNDCPDGVCVTPWYLNYDISEEDAYDDFTGAGWSYEFNNDTICIFQNADGPNYTIRKKLYFVSDSSTALPIFVSGNYFIWTQGRIRFDLENAIIKIFEWDPDSVVSGKIFTTPNRYLPISDVFWVDLTN